MQKTWLRKQEIVRTIWVVQAMMLLCEAGWIIINRRIYPSSGSLLEAMAPHLRLLGGSARFTFPIGLAAFVMDCILPVPPEGRSPTYIWLLRGIVGFLLLWGIGAVVAICLAIIFSWR